MNIPWSAYLIIGGAMALMSVFIDPIKLSLFILVGVVFILIGVIKLIFHLKNPRKEQLRHLHKATPPKAAHHTTHHPAHHTATHHKSVHPPRSHKHNQHPQHTRPIHPKTVQHTLRCANCGIQLSPSNLYCPHCGQKVK